MEQVLRRFNALLVEKNKVINLTAHKTEEDSWINNIGDSLLFLDAFPKSAKVLDLGSGCGCPAIPLKIALPSFDITMLDSVNKKVIFLNEAIDGLQLQGIRAVHTRIEDFKEREFNIVTARAVAPLPTLLEYAMPFLKVGGMLFAYKGSKWQDEINASKTALKILGGEVKEIKKHGETRSLIIIKKIKPTDKMYPRGKNLPRIKPL
jgi:16S rRNA (guanine527-N7)-methyltransferase